MKSIFVVLFSLILFGVFTSCDQENALTPVFTDKAITADDLFRKYDLNRQEAIAVATADLIAADLPAADVYRQISKQFAQEPSVSAADFENTLRDFATKSVAPDFNTVIAEQRTSGNISAAQAAFLGSYQAQVFNDGLSLSEVEANLIALTNDLAATDLSDEEKATIENLNATLLFGVSAYVQNRSGIGCAAGIMVTITAGFMTFNPLGVIAGGMMINTFC